MVLWVHYSLLDVEGCDSLREGQVESNAPWYTQLIDADVGIPSNDGTGREIHTLAHQVATNPPTFPLQSLRNGLHWLARLLSRLWNTCSGNMSEGWLVRCSRLRVWASIPY